MTIPSKLQQERDADLEMPGSLGHSVKKRIRAITSLKI
jgi:hypothetical protein